MALVRMAALFVLALLVASLATPVRAAEVEASGTLRGADVEGTIGLRLDPHGGAVSGTIEMAVRFDCRGKIRYEQHLLEIGGNVEGGHIRGTAIYLSRRGLPKDELSRCKSAYETYSSRKDSRAFVGTVSGDGAFATGTLGESGGTATWRVTWAAAPPQAPPPEILTQSETGEPAPPEMADPVEPEVVDDVADP